MTKIAKLSQQIKHNVTAKPHDPNKPVHCWSEPDLYNRQKIQAYVIILRTKGCSWMYESGCSMCGYFNDSALQEVSKESIQNQINTALKGYNKEPLIKIFTSGSYLDTEEIPKQQQFDILNTLYSQGAQKISVESRPEYITEDFIEDYHKHIPQKDFEVGIGLETADDHIREYNINKGFKFQDFKDAATRLQDNAISVKTYVLHKPPFLSERAALQDAKETIKKAAPYSNIISLNPVNVQKNTIVDYLYHRHLYRPPYLWSVIEILKTAIEDAPNTHIKCDPVGGGSRRGAHNGRCCDKKILSAIKTFSLTQDPTPFNTLDCECKKEWQSQLELEDNTFGGLPDIGAWRP